jgi:hypothetical protein
MTRKRRPFTRAIMREAYERAAGKCECGTIPGLSFYCGGLPLDLDKGIIYEHAIPWKISRDSSLSNCAVLRIQCAQQKTADIDLPGIAAVLRKHDRHIGALKPGQGGHAMPYGRGSIYKRTISGRRIIRKSQQQMHREMMESRFGLERRP